MRAACTSRRPRRRDHEDEGFSFIEVLLAIILIGIVVVPVLQAVTVSIKASSISRSAGQVETALVNAADRLNRAPLTCDYSIYAQAAVQTQGWAPEQVSLVQQYFVPGANVTVAGTWASGSATSPACQISTPTDGLVQRIRLTITSPDGSISRSVEVVKSDV
jgi:prepilin-type N-terminal cleavage/methylation domain-containing protein